MTNAKKHKKLAVTSLALAVAVFGSALTVGSAFAATSTTTKTTTAVTQKAAGQHQGGGHLGAIWHSSELTTLLGLTADELQTQQKAGKSLATIAAAQGVDVQKVIDLVTATLTKDLDKRLADGKITQTQYDEQKAKIATQASDSVNNTFTGKDGGGGHGSKGGRGGFGINLQSNADIASLLGLTTDELATQLQAGTSLSAIATAKGVSVDTLTAKVTTLLTAQLDKQLADGKITQTEYDTQKAKLADQATKLVTDTFKGHEGEGGGPGGRGGFGFHIDLQSNADIASLLGLTTDELATQLQAGTSLSAIATAKGVSVDTLTAKVTTLLTAQLDKQLADGKITQTEYDTQKAKLADQATRLVNDTFKGHEGKDGKGGSRGGKDQAGNKSSTASTAAAE